MKYDIHQILNTQYDNFIKNPWKEGYCLKTDNNFGNEKVWLADAVPSQYIK